MVLHNTSFERTLSVISKVRERIPASTQIMINMGDFSLSQADELKAAGADGSYHVWRLGEGTYTIFSKEQRFATIENIKKSGLDLYYCCEPIGPEHTPAQMAEQILKGVEYECFQHGALRRYRSSSRSSCVWVRVSTTSRRCLSYVITTSVV